MSKALVPYRSRSLARRDREELEPLPRERSIALPDDLPKGDGDVGEAALRILACARRAEAPADAPEAEVVVELLSQTEVAAGELLETQKRGRVVHRGGKWYFTQER